MLSYILGVVHTLLLTGEQIPSLCVIHSVCKSLLFEEQSDRALATLPRI